MSNHTKMSPLQKTLIRTVFAIGLGLLLILTNSKLSTVYLLIGIAMAIPSLYFFLSHLVTKKGDEHSLPIISTMILIFAATLILFPKWYFNLAPYVLGGPLVLLGVYQILFLLTKRKAVRAQADMTCYILPLILIIVGVIIVADTFHQTSGGQRAMVIFFGLSCLVYAAGNLWQYIRLNKEPEANTSSVVIKKKEEDKFDEYEEVN